MILFWERLAVESFSIYQSDLFLSEKDEQGGSNFVGGIRDLTIEETDGYGWNYEKSDDQGDHKISDQSSFDGGIYHGTTFLFKEWFVPVWGKEYLLTVNSVQQILLKIEYSFLRILSREIFSKTLPGFLIGRRPGRVCTVPGIGKLVLVKRKARMGRNPATGEAIKIPAKTVVKMRVAKSAKEAIVPGRK